MRIPRSALWLGALLCLGTPTSCELFGGSLMNASPEKPVDDRESYLEQAGGPQTEVDLGATAGGESLLSRFQQVLKEKEALERHQEELTDEVKALRQSLRTEQDRCAVQERMRAGAEAEAERLRRIKSDRELKILHLQMQLANMQSNKIELEIAGIEQQIEQLNAQAATPAAPVGTGR